MSNVIKLNAKPGMVNVKLKNIFDAQKSFEDDARDEYQKEIENSFHSGFKEGSKAAKQEAEKKYNQMLSVKYEELNKLMLSIEEKIGKYENEFENIVINAAFIISEKILKREIEKETIITDVLKEAVKKVLGANNVIIRLNPADLQVMNSENKNLFVDESYSKIKFEGDEGIEQGGCFVETEIGNVDARISSQLNELKKELENILTPA